MADAENENKSAVNERKAWQAAHRHWTKNA